MSKLLPSEKEVLLWQDKSEKAVLARLDRHYRDAMKDIEMKISSMLGRNDANLPHVIRRIEYQRMLKEQIQTVLERLHSNEYETISQYLTDSYTDAFVGTMYTLHQQDVPLILPIDQSVVMKAVTLDSKLKESLYTTMGKDMTALKKTVAEEVTRGIATGQMYSEIARNIRYAAGIPLRRAKTIARTEASRVQEQATFDAATEAKASGADVVKQWSSRRDGQTRDTHRMLDGQVREVNEPFTVNGKKAMHPHGFGVAELDINCRCTMLTRARAALDEDELKKLRERAVQHSLHVDDPKAFRKEKLPPLKNFAEFKKSYTKAAETLENTGKSGIIEEGKASTGSSKSQGEKVEFSADSDRLYEIKLSREKKKAIIERGISEETPVFATDTVDNKFASYVKLVPVKEGFYDVALHGRDTSVEFFGTNIDAYTLSQIIRQRKDYKPGTSVRLLSCSTGNTDNTGDCVAQIVANELGAIVEAPTDTLYVYSNGAFSIGLRNTGKMETFYPRK